MKRFAAGLSLFLSMSCAAKAPAPGMAPAPSASVAATASAHVPGAAPLAVASPAKAPWREPAMLTTPRHPLSDARVVAMGPDRAVVRTVNAAVWVLAAGGIERSQAVGKDEPFTPPSTGLGALETMRDGCAEHRAFLDSWARLIEPTSLATLRAPLQTPSATPCTPPSTGGRVRTAASAEPTEACEYAACLTGTTDQEPELTRTHLALVPGRCASAELDAHDASGSCREGARRTHEPDAVLADLEGRTVTFLGAPKGCRPTRALAVGGLPLLVCDGGPVALFAALPDGTWRSEGTLPVRDEELGGAALASDGTILLRAGWHDRARRRAFVRAPLPAGEASAWREVSLGDALDVRVAPGGAALVFQAGSAREVRIDLDRASGRTPLARVPLENHLVDASVERGQVVLWTLPRMHRGRAAAGSPAARGAAEGHVVLADGSLRKLPPAP